ncbi:squamosa promoter binding [Micractinium conductrix]|uniref:Squamosa promoter binding n=1 Tax=Micractinium conductrix TaxID=554055 RepID=A0A2P6VQ62_9CHLO|nr:squamosa promoter binding [Micractinium conductrix]|eukprot:PSC76211.1 squamosa promoter binding [Micractinium conductrix]
MAGKVQRFCQQCGQFHPIELFEGLMRSCRTQLARHAERRRNRRAQAKAKAAAEAKRREEQWVAAHKHQAEQRAAAFQPTISHWQWPPPWPVQQQPATLPALWGMLAAPAPTQHHLLADLAAYLIAATQHHDAVLAAVLTHMATQTPEHNVAQLHALLQAVAPHL